ncbi:MAG: methyltransferase domain-containing protein [Clostridia bacterium]|nr:methyltransferase domain-containing protein [Clostridia bacterium]
MAKNKNLIIISYQQEMASHARGEILTSDGQAEFAELDTETSLVRTVPDFKKISGIFAKRPPVFLRHIHPVDTVARLGENGVEDIVEAVKALAPVIDRSFSVQSRILLKNERGYTPFDINNGVSALFDKALLNVREPEQIISITVHEDKAYIGVSLARENLSSWAGGRIRFRHEPEQISRAEFKLLEAQSTFGISIFKGAAVLDLGAAPGGWSRICTLNGAHVTAVDPALLDEALLKSDLVTHVKATAQEYLEQCTQDFDLILNDMRMEPEESATLIKHFHPYLKEGGTVVLTLKLFGEQPRRQMLKAIGLLENYYTVVGVRQLFHNRSEVTVILKK